MPSTSSEVPAAASSDLANALAEFDEIVQTYHVMPHERWAALRILQSAYSPNPKTSRTTKKDGVIGCLGTGILYASGAPFALVGIGAMFVLFAVGASWASALMVVGIVGLCLSIVRGMPALLASQRYLKTGDWRPIRMRAGNPPNDPPAPTWQGPGRPADLTKLPPPSSVPPIPPPATPPPRNRGPHNYGDRQRPQP